MTRGQYVETRRYAMATACPDPRYAGVRLTSGQLAALVQCAQGYVPPGPHGIKRSLRLRGLVTAEYRITENGWVALLTDIRLSSRMRQALHERHGTKSASGN